MLGVFLRNRPKTRKYAKKNKKTIQPRHRFNIYDVVESKLEVVMAEVYARRVDGHWGLKELE